MSYFQQLKPIQMKEKEIVLSSFLHLLFSPEYILFLLYFWLHSILHNNPFSIFIQGIKFKQRLDKRKRKRWVRVKSQLYEIPYGCWAWSSKLHDTQHTRMVESSFMKYYLQREKDFEFFFFVIIPIVCNVVG